MDSPTASQALAAVHDTGPRYIRVVPEGAGTVWELQDTPFQPAAKPALPLIVAAGPTASHASAETHDTLL